MKKIISVIALICAFSSSVQALTDCILDTSESISFYEGYLKSKKFVMWPIELEYTSNELINDCPTRIVEKSDYDSKEIYEVVSFSSTECSYRTRAFEKQSKFKITCKKD